MKTIRSDSGTGKGLSKTEFTMVKIATFAPRHTASVRIAVTEKPRSFHKALIEIEVSRSTVNHYSLILFTFQLRPAGVKRIDDFLGFFDFGGSSKKACAIARYGRIFESRPFSLKVLFGV